MSTIEQIIEKLDPKNPESVASALAESMNDNNVKVGSKVAVVGHDIYDFDGQAGTVKSINNGFADVEFGGKMSAPIQVNMLIPV